MVQAWAAMDGVMPVQMGSNLLRILRKPQFPHWTGEGNPEGISGCQCVATSLVAIGAPTRRQRGICLPGCQHCHQTGHLPCHSCPCLYHPVQEERERMNEWICPSFTFFLFYLDPREIGWCPPTRLRRVVLLSPLIQMLISSCLSLLIEMLLLLKTPSQA